MVNEQHIFGLCRATGDIMSFVPGTSAYLKRAESRMKQREMPNANPYLEITVHLLLAMWLNIHWSQRAGKRRVSKLWVSSLSYGPACHPVLNLLHPRVPCPRCHLPTHCLLDPHCMSVSLHWSLWLLHTWSDLRREITLLKPLCC